ncbi:UNVERIFIED_CONTAM: hypothetical protein HDU68_006099 [Siphonaria sp. JEL0065]|nr:hypothetical protein HDU68_006099 [Siphonaria sp. JEL0065]
MGKTTKNATVTAVQQSIQQQTSTNVKNVLIQKPISRPQTPVYQKATMPLAPKPVFSSAANKASFSPVPTVKGNPLAPLTKGKAAAGLPDSVFGNMFDLPPKWVNACKPAKPVSRLGPSTNKVQQQQRAGKPKFTRKPRAPKNSTNEVFNIAFLYPETKFANSQPVAPKRVPGTSNLKKPATPVSRPTSAPSPKPVQKSNTASRPTTAGGAKPKSNSSPVDWQQNIWEDFYTANKHHTYVETKSKTPVRSAAAPKPAPNVNTSKRPASSGGRHVHESLKSKIPPPKEAKSPEIFAFLH